MEMNAMKTAMWLLTAIAAMMLVTSALNAADQPASSKPAASKPAGDKPKDGKGLLKGEYAFLVKEASLTDDQKTKLEQRVKAYDEAVANWEKENGEKLKDAKAKFKESKDAEAKKTIETLKAAEDQLYTDLWKDINAMLAPEQIQKYEAFKLYRASMQVFAKADLTDAQKQQARELCDAASKEIVALKDEKEKDAAKKNLHSKIEALLTPEQKTALTAKKPTSQPTSGPAKEHKEK